MKWWRIYYEGGKVFTSEDGSPYDAPRIGVQVIAEEHPAAGYELIFGSDYYCFDPDRRGWWRGDIFTAMDHLMRARRQCLLFGRIVDDEEWRALFERINIELGPRAGRVTTEPRREPET